MTTTTTPPTRPHTRVRKNPAARGWDLIGAEWIKIRSTRSTYGVILSAVMISIGLGALSATSAVRAWNRFPTSRGHLDPVHDVFGSFAIAQLVFSAIGVMSITSEYSSGLIHMTFAAAPTRRAVLAAKATVVGFLTLTAGTAAALIDVAVGDVILSGRPGLALTATDAAYAVTVTGAYLVSGALIGLGLGTILRNAAGVISVLFTLLFLLPQLLSGDTGLLLDVDNALPGTALRRLTTTTHVWQGAPSTITAWTVILVYPAIALLLAAAVIHRRDT